MFGSSLRYVTLKPLRYVNVNSNLEKTTIFLIQSLMILYFILHNLTNCTQPNRVCLI